MSEQDSDPILERLPPENATRNRTQVQDALRMRARDLRDEGQDDDTETAPVL